MGLTPLAGVMMGSRCGDIDPSLHAVIGRRTGLGLAEIDAMLNKRSGLRGICGMNDMRDIHAAREKGDVRARLAFAMFLHSIRKAVGAYYAVLGTVHALVFTAGIGENDSSTRAGICEGWENMGIAIDPEKNLSPSGGAKDISAPGAFVRTLVIPTNEELAIAEATMRVLAEKV
jgi:acetate kinase